MKTIFISYSHDSDAHMEWVKHFVEDLRIHGGLTVLYDQDVPKGASFTRFMEIGMQTSDRVLVIGTQKYKEKCLRSGGAAYEEALISNDLMNNIDSTKYFPILREGTFETSFPPILAGRNGDDFTDDSKYDQNLAGLISSLNNEKEWPDILKTAEVKMVKEVSSIAKLYFNVNILFETMFGNPTGKIEGIAFGVRLTNLSKEIRYYNRPFFRLSHSIDGGDSFEMLSAITTEPSYPVTLNYGQVVDVAYKLMPGMVDVFSKLIQEEPSVTIMACVRTTVGEEIKAEPYKLADLVKDFKYIR